MACRILSLHISSTFLCVIFYFLTNCIISFPVPLPEAAFPINTILLFPNCNWHFLSVASLSKHCAKDTLSPTSFKRCQEEGLTSPTSGCGPALCVQPSGVQGSLTSSAALSTRAYRSVLEASSTWVTTLSFRSFCSLSRPASPHPSQDGLSASRTVSLCSSGLNSWPWRYSL